MEIGCNSFIKTDNDGYIHEQHKLAKWIPFYFRSVFSHFHQLTLPSRSEWADRDYHCIPFHSDDPRHIERT